MAIALRNPLTRPVALLGGAIVRRCAAFGRFVEFALQTFAGLRAVRSWGRWSRLGTQLYFIGTTSVPVLALTGAFIGMILAIEGYLQFASIGQESRLGGVINLSVVKQLGPVLAAVILAGRVGCSLTAELGSMRVTEQLDAMRAMGADPVRVLVCPRFVACVAMIPALTILCNAFGMLGGWLITVKFYGTDAVQYWRFTEAFLTWWEVMNGIVKSLFFGGAIALIACYKGFTCKPGAEGVGRATTESFVVSFIVIILINLVLAKVLNDLNLIRYGGVMPSIFG